MHVIRRQAYQGHAVPATGGYPRGPFPPEVMASSVIIEDDNDPDVLYPPGATAQNDYTPTRMFRCNYCGASVAEHDTEHHACEEPHGED